VIRLHITPTSGAGVPADVPTSRVRAWRGQLLAAFTTLRFGEPASLRRRDIDTAGRVVLVQRARGEMQNGRLFDRAPKSAAGVRPVAFPDEILAEIRGTRGATWSLLRRARVS
jgi:hypothetical protein